MLSGSVKRGWLPRALVTQPRVEDGEEHAGPPRRPWGACRARASAARSCGGPDSSGPRPRRPCTARPVRGRGRPRPAVCHAAAHTDVVRCQERRSLWGGVTARRRGRRLARTRQFGPGRAAFRASPWRLTLPPRWSADLDAPQPVVNWYHAHPEASCPQWREEWSTTRRGEEPTASGAGSGVGN